MRQLPDMPLRLAGQHRQEFKPTQTSDPITGSFNICVVVTFQDGFKAVVRFPILGRSRFRVEKTNNELLIMNFPSSRIQVPVPEVLGTGMWECGPYVVMACANGIPLSNCFRNSTDPSTSYSGFTPHQAIAVGVPTSHAEQGKGLDDPGSTSACGFTVGSSAHAHRSGRSSFMTLST